MGKDYLEKRELRVFLIALRQRFEYFQAFKKIDTGGDGRISLREFKSAELAIEKWVGPIQPEAEFQAIDKNKGGFILFDEFCEWSIKKALDLEDDDELVDKEPEKIQTFKRKKEKKTKFNE